MRADFLPCNRIGYGEGGKGAEKNGCLGGKKELEGTRVQGIVKRLRAALTPQALALIAALTLLLFTSLRQRGNGQTQLEARASRVLSQMAGAGSVSVVIMTKPAAPQASGGIGLSASGGAQGSESPCGAVAVAQGADDPFVQMQLTQALCSLLGLPASSVSVVTGGE